MARSRSVAKIWVRVTVGVAVGGALGLFALRYVRRRMATRPPAKTTYITSDVVALVPETVFTDEEPTAFEAALRDAVSAEEAAAGDVAPDETFWIGNTRTLVLHRADSSFLPAEEHRLYFQSEDEALAAGYRRAANE